VDRARALDPLSRSIAANVGFLLAAAGRYDEGIRQLQATLELDPDFAPAQLQLCGVYILKGEARAALDPCKHAVALSHGELNPGMLGLAYGAAGDSVRATAVLHALEARANREYVPPAQFALVELGLGARERALGWLDSAYTMRDPGLLVLLPYWKPLHHEARFVRLLERLGLPPE
jgi:tetratricopeptide (TPR) repeat protein